MRPKRIRSLEKAFLFLCAAAVAVSAISYLLTWWRRDSTDNWPQITVKVTGHVRRPGQHQIPLGSTMFDLLQVAGVDSTTDLSDIPLSRELNQGDLISLAQLDAKIDAKKALTAGTCEVDYLKGTISIADKTGEQRPGSIGAYLEEGDRVACGDGSQCQLKLRDKSLVAIGNNAQLTMTKVAELVGEKRRTVFTVESGLVWANIAEQGPNTEYQFKTPHIIAFIRGTEFTVEVTNTETVFKLYEGLSYIQNQGAREGINVVGGQMVRSVGGSHPLRSEEVIADPEVEEFQIMQQERQAYYQRHRPLGLMFCGVPDSYVFIKMDPSRKEILTMHIPSNTWVGNLVEGFDEYDRAFLYGGAKFTVSITERILRTKVNKYFVFGRNDVRRSVGLIEGIDINVDSKASEYLKLSAGKRRLDGLQAIRYMSPGISGPMDAHDRQKEVLSAIFDGLQSKNILLTSALVARGLGTVDRNVSVQEAMQYYSTFNAVKGWKMKAVTMPGKYFDRDGETLVRPLLGEIHSLLN